MRPSPSETSDSTRSSDEPSSAAPRPGRSLIDPVDIADPAERKRVLNVLAQRRYRRRRREQQAKLEGLVQSLQDREAGDTPHQPSKDRRASRSLLQPSPDESVSPPSADTAGLSPSTYGCILPNDLAADTENVLALPTPIAEEPLAFEIATSPPGQLFSPDYDPVYSQSFTARLGEFMQDEQVQLQSFPDDCIVAVPELGLLRAAVTIATRLNSTDRLWHAGAQSIFQTDAGAGWMQLLPQNLRPTGAQMATSHHPVLDILPWPSMRVKLINMYDLPSDLWPRHPKDNSELNIFKLVCDMENGGIRVWGEDPTAENSWEVEQDFAEAWWWALDERIVGMANRRRAARGEPRLALGLLTNRPANGG